MEICSPELCTGCGMCTNICPHGAIKMVSGFHGFVFPEVDNTKCINCGLCASRCPAANEKKSGNTMAKIFAAWNKQEEIRRSSTSGGVFSLACDSVLKDNGMVAGVQWDDNFCPRHIITDDEEAIKTFKGSKYVQSNTGEIYSDVKKALNQGRKVLFSGTPCQVAALKAYLGKDYSELITVDLVCHGVPSYDCFNKHLEETSQGREIQSVQLRYKAPYWDFSNVRIDFKDGTYYQKKTVDDPYFTLFNIGYSLRESCHNCKYTSTCREGDITLADFWGYKPKNHKMRNFNRGVSLIAINTEKGEALFNKIKNELIFEEETYEAALGSNKSFSQPYTVPAEREAAFWDDYEKEMKISELCKKHITNPIKIPSLLFLRRLVKKYIWVIK